MGDFGDVDVTEIGTAKMLVQIKNVSRNSCSVVAVKWKDPVLMTKIRKRDAALKEAQRLADGEDDNKTPEKDNLKKVDSKKDLKGKGGKEPEVVATGDIQDEELPDPTFDAVFKAGFFRE